MTAVVPVPAAEATLPQACTPCLARLDARPWHRTLAVRVAGVHVGLRVDTPATAARVEELLEAVRVPRMDTRVRPNFSLELADASATASRRLRLVYRDHELVARRRHTGEALLDLVELLDEVSLLAVRDRLVLFATGVLTRAGEAVLLPGRLHTTLLARRPQLAEAGLELLRARTQQLTASGGELLLAPEDAGLATVLRLHADGRTVAGRFPVRTLAAPALGEELFDLRPAHGVFAAYAMVLNRQAVGAGAALRTLSALSRTARCLGMPRLPAGRLVSAVTDLAA